MSGEPGDASPSHPHGDEPSSSGIEVHATVSGSVPAVPVTVVVGPSSQVSVGVSASGTHTPLHAFPQPPPSSTAGLRLRSRSSFASLGDLLALHQQKLAAEAAAAEAMKSPASSASIPKMLRSRAASLSTLAGLLPRNVYEPVSLEALSALSSTASSWHAMSVADVCLRLHTHPLEGLKSEEAARRLVAVGRNELRGQGGISPIMLLLRHIFDFLMILLLLASAVSFGVGEYVDGSVILAIAVANVIIGFVQEFRAEKTLEALRQLSASKANVVRDGKTVEVPATDLVPGDVVLLDMVGAGSGIGADMRVIEAVQLDMIETTLTGESRPVHKTPVELVQASEQEERFHNNMVYSGCLVSGGRGRAIVVRTGMSTELGKITAKVTGGKQRKTALQKELHRVALILFGIGILFAFVVFASTGFVFPNPNTIKYTAVYAIALIVAIIPEELPLVMTLTMVLGMRRMASLNVIVRQLSALEQLGRVTDICSDKTGTITQASMVVVSAWTPTGAYMVTGQGVNPEGKLLPLEVDLGTLDDDGDDGGVGDAAPGSTADAVAASASAPLPPPPAVPAPGSGEGVPITGQLALLADIAAACNSSQLVRDDDTGAWRGVGQPTDVALQVLATKMGRGRPARRGDAYRYAIVAELPFDSAVKRMSVVVRESGKTAAGSSDAAATGPALYSAFLKGAAERVLGLCTRVQWANGDVRPVPADLAASLEPVLMRMAGQGQRVLALAARGACVGDTRERFPFDPSMTTGGAQLDRDEIDRDMVLVGLVGLQDPPRPGVRQAVLDCVRGGITVRMLTGDHVATAASISREVCIAQSREDVAATQVVDAAHFDSTPEHVLAGLVDLPRVVARCTPDSKVKMVRALHARQRVVAMTGDGVNDAPALRSANVGVAMGRSGSDVTRQAAHIVLADDNFVSIVSAIREGRRIFKSIKKFVVHVLATNVGMVLVLMIGLFMRDPNGEVVFPMSPLEILWLNMFVLSLPLIGIVTEPPTGDVMAEPPLRQQSVLTRDVLADIFVHGVLLAAIGLSVLTATLYGQLFGIIGTGCNSATNPFNCGFVQRARGTAFVVFSVMLLVNSYNVRDAYAPIWRGWRERTFNKLQFILCCVVAATVVLIVYVPGLNNVVFLHEMVTVEWGIAAAGIVVHFVLTQLWPLLKTRLMPPPTSSVELLDMEAPAGNGGGSAAASTPATRV